MKKNLFVGFIAMTALTVTSCTNDEVVEAIPQKQAIEFGTYLGRDAQARGVVTGGENDFTQFGVFAFYTNGTSWASAKSTATPNFMYNQAVNWNSNLETPAWEYTPKKYWPTTYDDKITFFAYAPMASTSNGIVISDNETDGTPTVTYTIDPKNLEKMADFVADALIDQTRQSSEETLDNANEDVTFVLNHELTRVNIQAQLSTNEFGDAVANETKVNITNIEFVGAGFAQTGTYTFADEKNVLGTWDYEGVGEDAFSIFDEDDALFVVKGTDTDLSTAGYTTVGVAVPATTVVDLFEDDQYLFLIPANGTDGITSAKNVSMYVSYDIVTADANLTGGYSKTSAVKEIVLPDGLLRQGTAYNILLTFGMNEIKLSASVDGWGDVDESGDANVDYPKTDK